MFSKVNSRILQPNKLKNKRGKEEEGEGDVQNVDSVRLSGLWRFIILSSRVCLKFCAVKWVRLYTALLRVTQYFLWELFSPVMYFAYLIL